MQGPFDGVVGFSQGAAVGFMLMLLAEAAEREAPGGRGLHSSTFQLNVSALCCIGGVFRGCVGGV